MKNLILLLIVLVMLCGCAAESGYNTIGEYERLGQLQNEHAEIFGLIADMRQYCRDNGLRDELDTCELKSKACFEELQTSCKETIQYQDEQIMFWKNTALRFLDELNCVNHPICNGCLRSADKGDGIIYIKSVQECLEIADIPSASERND